MTKSLTHVRESVLVAAATFVVGGSASGYELGTHERISVIAYNRSVLADPVNSPLLDLGVTDQKAPVYRARPIDGEARLVSAEDLVGLGARFEDLPKVELRFLNHFFDPQQGGIGLQVPPLLGAPSPAWVLEDNGSISQQDDSLRDALTYHMQALTSATKTQRDENLARLLEILGRSVHHLQDMAQPAHTRNDAHPPWPLDNDIYEEYTENNLSVIPSEQVYGEPAVSLTEFDTGRKFWTNAGRGVAEFTSRNFVSRDTNFRPTASGFASDPNHPLPVATASENVSLTQLGLFWTLNPSATVRFIHTQVNDLYSGMSFVNDRASTFSVFSADLQQAQFPALMSLNRFNFQKNYEILLPRAVAYSAGLLNYYFRGVLDVEEMTAQDSAVTLTIRNASQPNYVFSGSPGATEPDFRLYYDASDGQRRPLALVNNDLGAGQLTAGETRDFSFTEPNDLDRTKEKPYLLVFNGVIGFEPGIAAMAFGTAPSGFIVAPFYPTGDGVAGPRVIRWNEANWARTQSVGPVAGGTDWQGHDALDALSWGAGYSRYFAPGGSPVYMNGRLLTTGPEGGGGLIGASIRYVAGVRTLNVVKHTGVGNIAVYSRIFAEEYQNEDPWTDENPLGWRVVYAGTHGLPFTGFFFNASGTEGQYITEDVESGIGGPVTRVKVTLAGYTGSAVEFPASANVSRSERIVNSDTTDPEVTAGVCSVTPSAPDGELNPAPGDACQSLGMRGIRVVSSTHSLTDNYSDHTLFCVDYRGDEEVFCELAPPAEPEMQSTTWQLTMERDFFFPGNSGCGATRSGAEVSDDQTLTTSTARVLRVGNTEIPWTGVESSLTTHKSYAGNFSPLTTQYTGSLSGTSTVQSHVTKLIHADARHDLAVYETAMSEGTLTWSGNYSESSLVHPVPSVSNRLAQIKVVMQAGAQQTVLYESEESVQGEPGVGPEGGAIPGNFGCAQGSGGQDVSTPSTFRDPGANGDIFSHMRSHGFYAVDRAGRIAASQLILFLPSGAPTFETHGYRNFLTGGDLPALFPGVPSTQGYGYDVRVIR